MKEYEVTFSVEMKARVTIEGDEDLDDAISDIDIPENDQCKYVENSFEPFSRRHIK